MAHRYIGRNIYELRKKRGWSQSDLARKLDKKASTISSYETDSKTDDVLVGRVDDVVRDEHIRPISVSVNGGNVLMIKVIRTNSRYDSHAYICDTTLSVLQ